MDPGYDCPAIDYMESHVQSEITALELSLVKSRQPQWQTWIAVATFAVGLMSGMYWLIVTPMTDAQNQTNSKLTVIETKLVELMSQVVRTETKVDQFQHDVDRLKEFAYRGGASGRRTSTN